MHGYQEKRLWLFAPNAIPHIGIRIKQNLQMSNISGYKCYNPNCDEFLQRDADGFITTWFCSPECKEASLDLLPKPKDNSTFDFKERINNLRKNPRLKLGT